MRPNQNVDHESDTSSKESETVEVPLRLIHRQIGRVLELFIILQFVTGAFIFFLGIFLLLWSVAPATSLKAGSYMLLAFYVIGRALLGLVGFHIDNFCLLFSYGVLLVATFVIRTIFTLVRLKIMAGADPELIIPSILQACPGALSIPIELICSILECSQAFCSFYLCWIITKTTSIEKNFEETRLSMATEMIKYIEEHKKDLDELSKEKEQPKIVEVKCNQEKENNEIKNDEYNEKMESPINETKQNESSTKMPLKGILHQPNRSKQCRRMENIQESNVHHHHHHHQNSSNYHQFGNRYTTQLNDTKIDDEDCNNITYENEEDLDQIVKDYNNNINNGENCTNISMGVPYNHEYDYCTISDEVHSTNAIHGESHYMNGGYNQDYVNHSNYGRRLPIIEDQTIERVQSPTPPSEMNYSTTASSPLLYEQCVPQYNHYGSTNWQQQQHPPNMIYR
ncbi:hypothetical protein RDWZM_004094 [Blomia tropicalis]|uniref:Uncharacterized protein n=1 Tax=Blomia tropicalis TaxID=40697 RepID=A0A9Q0RT66_BLOTA|nr:hypothetical protein RDWZM_004094 [Blomia tropicalis]